MSSSKPDRFSALPAELRQHILSFAADLFTLRKCSTISHALAKDVAPIIRAHALPLARRCLQQSEILATEDRKPSTNAQNGITLTNVWKECDVTPRLEVRANIAWSIGAALEWQLLILRRVGIITIRPEEAPDPALYLVGKDLATDSRVRRARLLTDFRTFNDLASMLHEESLGRPDWWLPDDLRALTAPDTSTSNEPQSPASSVKNSLRLLLGCA